MKIHAPEIDVHEGPVKKIRVFIAHTKGTTDELLASLLVDVEAALRDAARNSGKNVMVYGVLGRDDYDANFKRCGSWDAWTYDVVNRIDYVTRDPYYHAIIVTDRVVGKATAMIASHALRVARPCLLFGVGIAVVKSVNQVSDDYKSGWEITT